MSLCPFRNRPNEAVARDDYRILHHRIRNLARTENQKVASVPTHSWSWQLLAAACTPLTHTHHALKHTNHDWAHPPTHTHTDDVCRNQILIVKPKSRFQQLLMLSLDPNWDYGL